MKENDVIKALECCLLSNEHQCEECEKCPLYETYDMICQNLLAYHALELIKRLAKEKDDLEYTLLGVMHSVDKWLEGDELKQHEVNRAITMREKTLSIVEEKDAEVKKLTKEISELSARNFADKEIRRIIDAI